MYSNAKSLKIQAPEGRQAHHNPPYPQVGHPRSRDPLGLARPIAPAGRQVYSNQQANSTKPRRGDGCIPKNQ